VLLEKEFLLFSILSFYISTVAYQHSVILRKENKIRFFLRKIPSRCQKNLWMKKEFSQFLGTKRMRRNSHDLFKDNDDIRCSIDEYFLEHIAIF
jgi:hypothetical protein